MTSPTRALVSCDAVAANWSHDMPSIQSVVSTRLCDSSGTTAGMRTHGWPAKWRPNSSTLRASRR